MNTIAPIAKISIDPRGIWDRFDFREFLTSVHKDVRLQKVYYIVTQYDPNNFEESNIVMDIQNLYKIPTSNVFYVKDENEKATVLSNLGVDFHFDGNSGIVDDLNLQFATRVPKFTAFYVNFIRNEYDQLMKYIDRFRLELNIFLNNQVYNRND